MSFDVVVSVKIVCDPLHSEVKNNRTLRYGSFDLVCCHCREVLLSGKRFADGAEEDLIWKAIRQHTAEHIARGDMRP